jgi:hypothetical protein
VREFISRGTQPLKSADGRSKREGRQQRSLIIILNTDQKKPSGKELGTAAASLFCSGQKKIDWAEKKRQ